MARSLPRGAGFLSASLFALCMLGCNAHQGTWFITLEVSASDSGGAVGQQVSGLGHITALSSGAALLQFAGLELPGTTEGESFSFEYARGAVYSAENCESLEEEQSIELSGDFTPDLGLDGKGSVTYAIRASGCGGQEDRIQRTSYALTGIKLNANDDLHAAGGATWGYAGGYF